MPITNSSLIYSTNPKCPDVSTSDTERPLLPSDDVYVQGMFPTPTPWMKNSSRLTLSTLLSVRTSY